MPIDKENMPSYILQTDLRAVTTVIQNMSTKSDLAEYQLGYLKQLKERRDVLSEAIVLLISKDL